MLALVGEEGREKGEERKMRQIHTQTYTQGMKDRKSYKKLKYIKFITYVQHN